MTRKEARSYLDAMKGENKFVNPYRKAALSMAIAALREQSKWIPVAERLPDWRVGKVLVYTKYGFSICERTVNNRWQGQHANWITHWMPLPDPPKEET